MFLVRSGVAAQRIAAARAGFGNLKRAKQTAQACSQPFVLGTGNIISFIGRTAVTLKIRPSFRTRNEQKRERTPWMT
jgi:hypothetical protein